MNMRFRLIKSFLCRTIASITGGTAIYIKDHLTGRVTTAIAYRDTDPFLFNFGKMVVRHKRNRQHLSNDGNVGTTDDKWLYIMGTDRTWRESYTPWG